MEQAVIVHLRFRHRGFGTQEERDAMYNLEGQLEQTIAEASVGEFDGHEFGEGECVFYIYGEDADQLFQAIEPILKATAGASMAMQSSDLGKPATRIRVKLA